MGIGQERVKNIKKERVEFRLEVFFFFGGGGGRGELS